MIDPILTTTPIDKSASSSDAHILVVNYLEEHKEFRGKNVSLDVLEGTKISLSLAENGGSTGYRWSVNIDDDSAKYLKVVDEEIIRPMRAGRPGAGSTAYHRFDLEIASGAPTELKFKLELSRPWEETVPPAATKNVTFNVSPNSKVEPFKKTAAPQQGILPGGCVMPPPPELAQAMRAIPQPITTLSVPRRMPGMPPARPLETA